MYVHVPSSINRDRYARYPTLNSVPVGLPPFQATVTPFAEIMASTQVTYLMRVLVATFGLAFLRKERRPGKRPNMCQYLVETDIGSVSKEIRDIDKPLGIVYQE